MARAARLLAVLALAALALAPGASANAPKPRPYQGPPIATPDADRCDWLDTSVCLYPFPNDFFTVRDPATATGRRLHLSADSMPHNRLGRPIDPGPYNRVDGFSPGTMIVVKVPGLTSPAAIRRTGAVRQGNLGRYDDPAQPVVVIDARTGERQPIWAEVDANPADPRDRTLIVRPAVNWREGHRYIVALSRLRDAVGAPLPSPAAFRVYRDRLITGQAEVEARRPAFERIFGSLRRAGIGRRGLYMAWDFTVRSRRSLAGAMLHIRDDAFGQLGDANLADLKVRGRTPAFAITDVEDFTAAEDPRIAREVKGVVRVPCYLDTRDCAAVGSTFNYGPDGLPAQMGAGTDQANVTHAAFTCLIPRSAIDGPAPRKARPSLYGHGLLGSQGEVEGGNVKSMAAEHGFVFCATDWFGFATQNVPNVLAILQDLSNFPLLADGTQQGFLNFLYLGRAMIHPRGLAADPAFHVDGTAASPAVIDTRRLFYDGNSQGGILGGALTALAPDFNRAVLGVPGMNYSTLLRRSVDFEPYAEGKFGETVCEAIGLPVCPVDDTPLGLYDNYPDELERPLIFALMQTLWDPAEANGYAQHMTADPLPNTPRHRVLMQVAFGDHQVANVTAEVEARTIGARLYRPALDRGRYRQARPFWGLAAVPRIPWRGSAIVYWDGGPLGFDGGTASPPNSNVPPRPPKYGEDPHSYPRNDPLARLQKAAFLAVGGRLINPCRTGAGRPRPCYSNGWHGAR
jgi:hypothetical protein